MRIAFLALVAVAACGSSKPAQGNASASDPQVAPGGASEPVTPAAPNSDGPGPKAEATPAAPRSDATPAAPKVEPTPAAPKAACAAKPNPAGCPATEPNINARCKKNGLECTYGTSCCPPLYVCNKLKFEARFQSCPK